MLCMPMTPDNFSSCRTRADSKTSVAIQNINYGQGNLDMRPPSPGSIADPFHGLFWQDAGYSRHETNGAGLPSSREACWPRLVWTAWSCISFHGYFFTQVISSSSNDRAKHDPNDPYGGELKNRFRFWDEVIRGIKNDPKTCHLPLIVKLSVIEDASAIRPWRPQGNTIEESIQVAKWAEEAGADAFMYRPATFFLTPRNPAGYLNTRILKEPMPGCARAESTAASTFGCSTICPSFPRLAWERRLRDKLYTSFWQYLLGKRPEPDSSDAAWRKFAGHAR